MLQVLTGVETLEVGIVGADGTVQEWTTIENIEADSVSLTSNTDTQTAIIPEDKDVAILTLYTPGDPDALNFALLEISAENLARYYNVIYTAATSSTVVMAKRKRPKLAYRLTSRPVEGVKQVVTWYNTSNTATYKNNIAKTGLLAISVVATTLPWKHSSGQDALYVKQLVDAETGVPINGTPATVGAGADSTSSTASKSLTGTAAAAGTKTIIMTEWTQVSGPSQATIDTPNSLTATFSGLVNGVYKFRLTAIDSVGVESHDDVQVTVTIA